MNEEYPSRALRSTTASADHKGGKGVAGTDGQPSKLPPGGTPASESDDRPPSAKKLPANRNGHLKQSRQRRIDATFEDLPALARQAWLAIQEANNPPTLFRHGAAPSRIEHDDHGTPMLKIMTVDRMRHRLARDASWFKREKKRDKPIPPPLVVVKDILATPDPDLPVLIRIVEAPVFANDGSLCTDPGYNPRNKTFFAPAPGFEIPNVSMLPTAAEVKEARKLLTVELIGDFPFVGKAEVAHAVSATLGPFVRDMIEGPTPIHSFEAPSPGTGKTLLATAVAFPALGRSVTSMTEGRTEDEWRKRILAKLRSAPSVLLLDNLTKRVDSGSLSSAITSYPLWEDRLLGESEIVRVPNWCTWLATGNNPSFSSEIIRRVVRIRLDSKQDQPWLREGPRRGKSFRHPNILGWAEENRHQLVWAALTLIQAWIVAGRPEGKKTLGMFERWAQVMGGILDVVDIPGFLGNLEDFYEKSDAEGAAWRAFVAAWWTAHSSVSKTVADLWPLVADCGLDLGDKGDQSQKIKLGKLLKENFERTFTIKISKPKPTNNELGPEPLDGQGDDTSEEITLRIETDGTERRATLWKLAKQDEKGQENQDGEYAA